MNLHIENNNIHVNHDGPDGPQGFSLNGKADITDAWEHDHDGDGDMGWLYISCEKCNDSKRIELNPCDDIVLTHPNSFPGCSAYVTCECTGQRKIVIR